MPHLQLALIELTPAQRDVTLIALVKFADSLSDLLIANHLSDHERLAYQEDLSNLNATLAKLDPKHFPKS